MAINETIYQAMTYAVDNTISCGIEDGSWKIRAFAFFGLVSLLTSLLNYLFGSVVTSVASVLAVVIGLFRFVFRWFKERLFK